MRARLGQLPGALTGPLGYLGGLRGQLWATTENRYRRRKKPIRPWRARLSWIEGLAMSPPRDKDNVVPILTAGLGPRSQKPRKRRAQKPQSPRSPDCTPLPLPSKKRYYAIFLSLGL